MKQMKSANRLAAVFFLLAFAQVSCKPDFVPKPRSYFRIDLPEKKYRAYTSTCGYGFDYPEYGTIRPFSGTGAEPCWINIEFPTYRAKVHITYKPLRNNLSSCTEDIRTLAYKHLIKADDIVEKPFSRPASRVYGIVYDIRGSTASSLSFYATDSLKHFLSGSLYFSVRPNKDSLAPVIRFFTEDVERLIETLHWD